MGGVPVLACDRVVLREWRAGDLEPFAAMNADPRVMEHFPAPLTREQSDAVAARFEEHWRQGFGPWALEERASGDFIGYVGFLTPSFVAAFTPAVEIGWRLAYDAWGHGYATEAATAALAWARETMSPPRGEIVSFTTVANLRSRRVMERLGFAHRDSDDFDHPLLPDWEHRRHVLYRLSLAGEQLEGT
jgi:RimJ/RimL family protein N-acetyltransferase